MISTSALAAFLIASVVLVLVPGPGQALVLARSMTGGFRAGLAATLGLNTGTVLHAVAAGFGLSAVLAASATAFTVVKLVGAAYLVVLGVLAWRSGGRMSEAPARRRPGGYLSAVLVGTLNPKVALFFLAFLPQFVDPERGAVPLQFLLLGLILAGVGLAWDCVLSLAAHAISLRIAASQRIARWRARITGALFVALGLRLAVTEHR